jgi:hypothetical protein
MNDSKSDWRIVALWKARVARRREQKLQKLGWLIVCYRELEPFWGRSEGRLKKKLEKLGRRIDAIWASLDPPRPPHPIIAHNLRREEERKLERARFKEIEERKKRAATAPSSGGWASSYPEAAGGEIEGNPHRAGSGDYF